MLQSEDIWGVLMRECELERGGVACRSRTLGLTVGQRGDVGEWRERCITVSTARRFLRASAKKKRQLGISKLCRRVIRPTNHSVRRVCPVHVNILTIIPVLGYIVD